MISISKCYCLVIAELPECKTFIWLGKHGDQKNFEGFFATPLTLLTHKNSE